MVSDHALPEGFEDLRPFVEEWGMLETQDARYSKRQALPMERLIAFYEAVTPRLSAIFEHLNGFPYSHPLPPCEALLFRLVMGMSEATQAVEVYGQPTVPNAPHNHSVEFKVLKRV